ncbi:NAD(P)/FAD-dependent oxidoreductase, partial [Sulfitobacter sp.]|nr:NAD(P)/FAD-dependent oxidoreductase [Sulfitobacter sp.]
TAKIALLQEMATPLPKGPAPLAALIKALPISHDGLRPMDEAISTAGGVTQAAVDEALMIKALPNTYAVGEMLDWEAPTGGYLITACLATGAWAGQHAAARLNA